MGEHVAVASNAKLFVNENSLNHHARSKSIMDFRGTSIEVEEACRSDLRNCIDQQITTLGCKRSKLLTALWDYAERAEASRRAGLQAIDVPIVTAIKDVELVKLNYVCKKEQKGNDKGLADAEFYRLVVEVAQDSLKNFLVSELQEMCENGAPQLLQMIRDELKSSRSGLLIFFSIIQRMPPVHNAVIFEHNGSIKVFPGTVYGIDSYGRVLRRELAALCDCYDDVKYVKRCIKVVEEVGQDSLKNFIIQLQQVAEETVQDLLKKLTLLQLVKKGIKELTFAISNPTFLILRLSIARAQKEPFVHNGPDPNGKVKLEQIDAGFHHPRVLEGHYMLSEVAETSSCNQSGAGRPTGPREKDPVLVPLPSGLSVDEDEGGPSSYHVNDEQDLLANHTNDEPIVDLPANRANDERDSLANGEHQANYSFPINVPSLVDSPTNGEHRANDETANGGRKRCGIIISPPDWKTLLYGLGMSLGTLIMMNMFNKGVPERRGSRLISSRDSKQTRNNFIFINMFNKSVQ